MNYAYTSARVRVMENFLPTSDIIRSLAESKTPEECIGILNSSGFEGSSSEEIVSEMNSRKAQLLSELIADIKEIEVIFYPKIFHNLKAAAKMLYSKCGGELFYKDVPISGEEIMNAIKSRNEELLPPYIAPAAKEVYRVLVRTGDGRRSDMIADKACLDAMSSFAKYTKYGILKSYVNEIIAAADIKIALRASNDTELSDYLVDCSYFSADALVRAVRDGSLDEFLGSVGFEGVNAGNIDYISEKKLAQILSKEKYNIFTPAPAINFILEYDRAISIIRYILICKANGIDKISERVNAYV